MTPRPAPPRRTCPACQRRYAALVAPDCVICRGLGVLTLGAAALHHNTAPAVSRAVELYLETRSRRAAGELPLGDRPAALEAAVDELRLAGVLASTADVSGTPAHHPGPRDPASARVVELDAHRLTADLDAPVTVAALNALDAPLIPLSAARPRDGRLPLASANGSRSALATIADPIGPLSRDTAAEEADRLAEGHASRVIVGAVDELTRRRARQSRHPSTRTR